MGTSGRGLEWSVEVPDRAPSCLGARRPRATLLLRTDECGEERVSVPLAVGRRLRSSLEAGASAPSSRAELLHEVCSLSRSCAHDRAEYLIGRRDYPSGELARKLRDDGYPASVVDAVVGRFVEVGIVDDARFASAFARSKALSGWGSARISRELERRGVSADVIGVCLEEELDEGDERERALAAARSRRFTGKDPFAQAVRFLRGRGYPLALALEVARDVADADGEL